MFNWSWAAGRHSGQGWPSSVASSPLQEIGLRKPIRITRELIFCSPRPACCQAKRTKEVCVCVCEGQYPSKMAHASAGNNSRVCSKHSLYPGTCYHSQTFDKLFRSSFKAHRLGSNLSGAELAVADSRRKLLSRQFELFLIGRGALERIGDNEQALSGGALPACNIISYHTLPNGWASCGPESVHKKCRQSATGAGAK